MARSFARRVEGLEESFYLNYPIEAMSLRRQAMLGPAPRFLVGSVATPGLPH